MTRVWGVVRAFGCGTGVGLWSLEQHHGFTGNDVCRGRIMFPSGCITQKCHMASQQSRSLTPLKTP